MNAPTPPPPITRTQESYRLDIANIKLALAMAVYDEREACALVLDHAAETFDIDEFPKILRWLAIQIRTRPVSSFYDP